MTKDELKGKRFYSYLAESDKNDDNLNIETIYEVKLTHYNEDDESKIMLQIVDISQSITLNEKIMENEMLEVVNATVSHELRTPLSSFMGQNIKKAALYNDIK